MDVGRLHAAGPDPLHARRHGGVGRAPAHEDQLRVPALVVDLGQRDVRGDAGDLVAAQVDHALVVDALVGHVAAAVRLLEPADAVLEAGHAGRGPRPRQRLGVADVGPEARRAVVVGVVRLGGEGRVDRLERVEVGQAPGLRPVGQVAVGEHDDRRAVLDGQAGRLDRDGEAVARRLRGEDRQRGLAVAPVERVEEVRLLGLGRQARRRPAALHVDDDQRQLEIRGQAQGLGLEVEAGTARRGDAERTAEGGPERGADRRRSRPRPGRCGRRTPCAGSARAGCPTPG